MRYFGQFRDRNAPLGDGPVTREGLRLAADAFHRIHEQTVGYGDPRYPTEIVRLHLTGAAPSVPPRLAPIAHGGDAAGARKGTRGAHFAERGWIDTAVYDAERLPAGARLEGPAIVEARFTTFVLPPGAATTVDRFGNLVTILGSDPQ